MAPRPWFRCIDRAGGEARRQVQARAFLASVSGPADTYEDEKRPFRLAVKSLLEVIIARVITNQPKIVRLDCADYRDLGCIALNAFDAQPYQAVGAYFDLAVIRYPSIRISVVTVLDVGGHILARKQRGSESTRGRGSRQKNCGTHVSGDKDGHRASFGPESKL